MGRCPSHSVSNCLYVEFERPGYGLLDLVYGFRRECADFRPSRTVGNDPIPWTLATESSWRNLAFGSITS